MAEFKQEMPPPGGYSSITYKRVPPAKGFGILTKIGFVCGVTAVGWIVLSKTKDKLNIERIEMRCARQALHPMLSAEADRMFLRQIRKNREDEEKVMKDVEGWEVGKYKGSPVYLTLGPDEFFKPHPEEYYAHCDPKFFKFILKTVDRN